jgi:DNA mismatch repair protein MutS2
MFDGKAVGTIDSIEKNKATVNYGVFTSKVSLEALELLGKKSKQSVFSLQFTVSCFFISNK